MKTIIFSKHSIEKIRILNNHGFMIDKCIIINAIEDPDDILECYSGQVQKNLDTNYLLRVIVEIIENSIKVITIYPAKRNRYERKI